MNKQSGYLTNMVEDVMSFSDYQFRGLTQQFAGSNFSQKQKELLQTINQNQYVIVNKCRQGGVSVAMGAYALWYALFTGGVTVLILCPNHIHAVDFKRNWIDFAYEKLPGFLKNKSDRNSKHELRLSNGSAIIVTGSNPSSICGQTVDLVICDEAGFIPHFEDLFHAVYPTIKPKNGKLVIASTSTKRGTFFHHMWVLARRKRNSFTPVVVDWLDIPRLSSRPELIHSLRQQLSPESFDREIKRKFTRKKRIIEKSYAYELSEAE